MTPDELVSSHMGLFIGRQGDWRMVELLGLKARLRVVNAGCLPTIALYLYGDPAHSIIYGIMGAYQNYSYQPRTHAHDQFNKAMLRLHIDVKYGFVFHQNFECGMVFILD